MTQRWMKRAKVESKTSRGASATESPMPRGGATPRCNPWKSEQR